MLTFEERFRLRTILGGRYEFVTARGRRTLLETAELGRFVPGMLLDADTQAFTTELILTLEKYGMLGPPSTFHALGALFGYLVLLEDFPPDQRRFFAELIVRYGLSEDRNYLERLRATFRLEVTITSSRSATEVPILRPGQIFEEPPNSLTLAPSDEAALEAVINSEDNFLDIHLLAGALESAGAVCLVEIPRGEPVGTGFLVGPDLVLTNHHVIPKQDLLGQVALRFAYQADVKGGATQGDVYSAVSDFFVTSPEAELDYTLFRVNGNPSGAPANGKWGYLRLSGRSVVPRERVNIIQHPGGLPKKVVLTQNYVASVTGKRVQYVADTLPGSSGSPVFDRNWNVVAIHHSGSPYPPPSPGEKIRQVIGGRWRVNEGVAMRPILDEIGKYLPS
jgi:hypothetical protein